MKRKKPNSGRQRKIIFAAAGFAALVLIVAAYALYPGGAKPSSATPTPAATVQPTAEARLSNGSAGFDFGKYPELQRRLQAFQEGPVSKRPDYLPKELFANLPPFPEDFYAMKVLVEFGKIPDLGRVGEEYYKQPEFYPQFETNGVQMMQNPPVGRWAPYGYGSYPSETLVATTNDTEFTVYTYFHSSWLVESYQGLGLVPVFPAVANMLQNEFPDGARYVAQNPNEAQKYFDVSITPGAILLEPAFPVFGKNWAQRVAMKIKVKGAPKGRYVIGIGIGSVPKELDAQWVWKYKTAYNTGGMAGIDVPWYQAFIQVS